MIPSMKIKGSGIIYIQNALFAQLSKCTQIRLTEAVFFNRQQPVWSKHNIKQQLRTIPHFWYVQKEKNYFTPEILQPWEMIPN